MFERVEDSEVPRRPTFAELASRAGLGGVPRTAVAGVAVLVVVAVALAGWRVGAAADGGGGEEFAFETDGTAEDGVAGEGGDANGPAEGASAGEAAEADPVWVHVAGRVRTPGLYELAPGARAGDALAAAGGPLEDAEIDAINLARLLADGEQVYVPSTTEVESGAAAPAAGESAPGGGASAGSGEAAGTVDINRADAAELDTLPGVGASTAAKIIADREANGPFATPEDLMRVPGIGEKKFDAMREMVAVR